MLTQIFKGPIARSLILSFMLLTAVAVGIAIGAIWLVWFTDDTLTRVAARADTATLSAHIRSESLVLTELVQRHTLRLTPETDLRALIADQQAKLDTLIQHAIDSTDPNDVDEAMVLSRVRQYLIAFSAQTNRVLTTFDAEGIAGPHTAQELAILVQNYQEPLVQALRDFELFESNRGQATQAQARQVVQTMLNVLIMVTIMVIVTVGLITHQVLTYIIAPLTLLRTSVDEIRQHKLAQSIPLNRADEMGWLAGALNTMWAELRQYQENLEELVRARTTELTVTNQRLLHEATERERAEKELSAREHELRMITDNIPVFIGYVDGELRYRFVNKKYVEAFGLNTQEIIGRHVRDVLGEAYYNQAEANIKAALAGQEISFESILNLPRLGPRWLSVNYVPEVTAPGTVGGVYIMVLDITERKRIEDELHALNYRFELYLKYIPIMMYAKDADTRAIIMSRHFEQLLGKPISELLGKTNAELWPPEFAEPMTLDDEHVIKGDEAIMKEETFAGRYYYTFKFPIKEPGQPPLLGGYSLDITELKQTQESLRQAKDAAEAANRAKSAFLANMSHELRTPLNAILGFSQLMTHSPTLPAEHHDNLGIIITSGEHLLTMINQVLDLSKIEAGHMSLEETNFNLHRLLDDLEGMFQLRATDKNLHLVIDQDPTIPPSIRTDEVKLRQVLINLLGNAVKFTNEGSVTLRVGRQDVSDISPRLPSTDYRLLFAVEDTGPGIAPDELATIFDAFTQTQTGRQMQEGTGLGLAISQRFVRLLGGDLTAHSEVGQGATFTFDIPVKVIEASAALAPASPPARRVVGLMAGQPTYRLLVVDDKAPSRQILVKLLAPLGFDLREAINGQEAIEVWAAWQPHLIWMDMRMPEMDGYEATRRIKASPQGQSTLIIAATASAFTEDRAQILAAGCDDFIRKPVREAELFEILARRLGVQFVYEETQSAPGSRRPQLQDLRADLQGLPVDLLTTLEKAAIQADMEMIDQLLDQIRSHNPDLADELAALADDFEYHAITALLQEV